MGASLVVREHVYTDTKELARWVEQVRQQDAWEHGNSYSGYWNMCHARVCFDEARVFDTVQQAREHIAERHVKGEPLLAVAAWKVLQVDYEELRADKPCQELEQALQELQKQIWQQSQDIVKRAKQAKSRMRGCEHCASRINVEHLRETRCPVCSNNLLRTAGDDRQLETWNKKVRVLNEKLDKRKAELARRKFKVSGPTCKVWVVGGWCAS